MIKNQVLKITSLVVLILVFGCQTKKAEKKSSITDFSKLIQKVPGTSILEEEGYFVWGGSVVKVHRLERFQILLENDQPIMMYCACRKGESFEDETFNMHIPLKH